VVEWSITTDCKSVGFGLRWFKSNPAHLAKLLKICIILHIMASQENLIKLVHKATGHTYWSRKNRKKLASIKIKLKKFNPILRKVVEYVETKK